MIGTVLQAARCSAKQPFRLRSENAACWTDGFNYELCCRDKRNAECFDSASPSELIYSYERCCSSPCNDALRVRLESAASANCAKRIRQNTTIVTGLWDLGREKWPNHARYKEGSSRSYSNYLTWLDAMLQKEQALLLFLDATAAAFALERRREYQLLHLTCVVEVPMEDLPQMRWRSDYEEAHRENARRLPHETQPEVVSANYTLVVNSKPELLACAASWNPFRSVTFAWVDAGVGRKDGFPKGHIQLPSCKPWSLCVARRMWIFFDFKSKLKRLEHGSTFDSTVLLGGVEGVLLYALWFQWAISKYLAEKVMDDEQGVIAEVWWAGYFSIQSFYGMRWEETTRQMLADSHELDGDPSVETARRIGRWFGGHPSLVEGNSGSIWIPLAENLALVKQMPVNTVTDDDLERVAYAMWCSYRQYDYYQNFCKAWHSNNVELPVYGIENVPIIGPGKMLEFDSMPEVEVSSQ